MKKLTIKVITMMVVIICIVSAIAVPASAQNFNYSGWKYTAVTSTSGKSIATFSGSASSNISSRYLSLYSYCQGGSVSAFNTILETHVTDSLNNICLETKSFSTIKDGTRTHEYSIDFIGSSCPNLAYGVSIQSCESKTNNYDMWGEVYTHHWDIYSGGWKSN